MSALEAMAGSFPVVAIVVLMIVAAVIDGWKLKVPNWLTYPMIFSGWLYWATQGWAELGHSIAGTFLGVVLLFVIFMVGAVGAGDVKMFGGFGAWTAPLAWFGYTGILYAFAISVIVGGILGAIMIWWQGTYLKNVLNAQEILNDLTTKSIAEADAAARKRKPTLQLLPYGIPLAIGSIAYMAWIIPVATAGMATVAMIGG